jgi:import inner membrane translocase subunit TIM22
MSSSSQEGGRADWRDGLEVGSSGSGDSRGDSHGGTSSSSSSSSSNGSSSSSSNGSSSSAGGAAAPGAPGSDSASAQQPAMRARSGNVQPREWFEIRLPPAPLLPGQPGSTRPLGMTHLQFLPPFFNPTQSRADHMMGSVFGKYVLSGVMGGGLGLVFGAFMTTMSFGAIRSEDIPTDLPLRRQFTLMGRRMWSSMKSSSRNFAVFGAMYAPTEQMTAVIRGRHDVGNSLIAGCLTGAGMAVTGGPYAMGMGCAGCAALCGLMDHFFIHKSS